MPKLSQHLQDERAFVEKTLGDEVICDDCGATLKNYAGWCHAELSELCPGFERIEDVKDMFAAQRMEQR